MNFHADAGTYTVGTVEGTGLGNAELNKLYLLTNEMFKYDGKLTAFEYVAQQAGSVEFRVRIDWLL